MSARRLPKSSARESRLSISASQREAIPYFKRLRWQAVVSEATEQVTSFLATGS